MNVVTPFEGIGASVRRKEDFRFLQGRGAFTDDADKPGQLHAWILRSPYAHARIKSIDSAAAASMPGVVKIYTGADMANELEQNDDDAASCFLEYAKTFHNWTDGEKTGLAEAFEDEGLSEAEKDALNAFADFLKECAK